MSLYEDFTKDNKKTSGGTGLYQKFTESKQPKPPSILSQIATGFKDMIVNPAPAQQEFEKQALPEYYKGDSKFLKAVTAPGTAIARGIIKTFSRVIHPGLEPLASDVANIYEVSRKGGIADQVAAGKIPKEHLDDIEVLKKSAPQIVGDVAQAVLTLYSGGAAKNVVTGGVKGGLYAAFKAGVKEAAPIGALFGGAQAASSGETDIKKIATTLGVSTITAGLLGGILKGTIPASKMVSDKIAKLFKEKQIKLPVNFTSKETSIPVSTPKTRFQEYNKSQGYEPYLNPNELPVIDMGAKPKSDLPVIQMGEKTPKQNTGSLRYDPIEEIKRTASAIVDGGKGAPEVRTQIQREIAPKQELNPIFKEAKKYSTPEEFVKAQGDVVFRGGDKDIDISRGTGRGISVSDKKTAELFTAPKGGVIGEAILPKSAKILKETQIPKDLQKAYIDEAKVLADPNNFSSSLQKSVIEKQQAIIDYARKNGFDAVEFPFEKEIRIIKSNILKTKSELTDIWNKASQPVKKSPLQPLLEPKQPKITGETIVPKAATKVEEAAVEKGIVSRFEGLPEAQKMNMKEQSKGSTELTNTDFERAKRVAMGDETAPGDLRPASVFEAVKQKALMDNDATLLKDLATKSTVPTRGTALGQEIKAFDTGIDNTDPVSLMQDVIKSREKKVGDKTLKTQDVKRIKEHIRKNAPTKEDWNSFINNIEC